MKRSLYVYTKNNRKLESIPEFANSILVSGDPLYHIKNCEYINLSEENFNNEFIERDIDFKKDNSHVIFFVMKENYLEVRNLEYSFNDYYIANYKYIKGLLQAHRLGLDHEYWLNLYRESGNSYDDFVN